MSTSKYLKIVGRILLVESIIGILVGFAIMMGITFHQYWATNIFGYVDGFGLLLLWIIYLVNSFLAPAFGILFINAADLMDKSDKYNEKMKYLNEIKDLKERVTSVEKNFKNQNNLDKEIKNEDNRDNSIGIANKKEIDSQNNINIKNISNYQLGDRIIIIKDISINGDIIKMGATGIIDNRLHSYQGFSYVVILDESGKSVEISEDSFSLFI